MADEQTTSYPIYNQYIYKQGIGWVMMGASDGSSGATIQINDGTIRNLDTLVINRLTRAEFEALTSPSPDQLYIITDDVTYATVDDLPQPGNTTPQEDGTGSAGSASTYSRSDHVHPTDTSRAAASHTHGNITNAGTLQSTDITIANGDKLVVTDASNSNKVARTSAAFDGSTATKFLTKKGTFESAVTAVGAGSTNGTISVTIDGSTNDVAVKGLGNAAYENSGNLVHYNESQAANTVLAAPNGVNGVPTFRKLAAEDIPTLNYVPTSRTVNGKQLNQNITLSASDVSAIPTSEKGAANGVAELDSSGKVPSSQLPSYVDDVLEYSSLSNFPAAGETGKIYVDTNSNKTYRWSGTQYVEISPSLALGETSSTAYRGDKGKIAYDHASAKGSAFSNNGSDAFYKFQTNAEGHVTSVTGVTKTDITNLGIPAQDTTYVFDGDYNASSNKAATVSTVTNAINALDGGTIGTGSTTKTITSLSQTNGNVSATFNDIAFPVTSVNTKTGAVVLTAADVGALPDSTDLSIYMQKGVDYVTAGQKSGTTLGERVTAEGHNTTASGYVSHAEGNGTTASGSISHAEGDSTTASGMTSHAEGLYTIARRKSQHVFGEYNVSETGSIITRGQYVEIVGNGTSTSARSNARTLDWSGNETLAGKLTLGADPTANMDAATKQYVDTTRAAASHTHGDITNDGDITATATIASGDRLVINDESASKVTNSSITFGDAQNLFLANDGTWQRPQGIFSVIADYDIYTNQWVGRIDTPELYEGLTMVLFLPFDPNDNVDTTTDGNIFINLILNDNTETDFEEVYSQYPYPSLVYADYFTQGNSIVLTYWDLHNCDETVATGNYRWFTNEPLPESDNNINSMLLDLGLVNDVNAFSTNSQNIIDETGNIIVNSYINQGGGLL